MARLSPANANLDPSQAATTIDVGADLLHLPTAEGWPRPTKGRPGKATLYHFPTSLYSQQVRLALAEKGVEWDGKTINIGPAHEHLEPWYAKINPRLVVPTLAVDGTIVTNTTQIIQYIDDHFHGPALMPADPQAASRALTWMEREAALPMRELGYARTKGITRWAQRWSLRQRRKQLQKLRTRNPELEPVYAAKLEDLAALEQAIASRAAMSELVDQVEILLDELEVTLGEHEWVAGPDYSLADLVWTAVLAKLEHIGFARSLREHRRPRVHHWYTRLRERPSWGSMIRRLTPMEVARFYGPAAVRGFLIFWVLKWALVGGSLWLLKHFVTN